METVNRSRIRNNQQSTSRPAPPDAEGKASQIAEIYHISQVTPFCYLLLITKKGCSYGRIKKSRLGCFQRSYIFD